MFNIYINPSSTGTVLTPNDVGYHPLLRFALQIRFNDAMITKKIDFTDFRWKYANFIYFQQKILGLYKFLFC